VASDPDTSIELGSPIGLPNFDLLDRTGVYFLYRDGVVVYVGQAVDIRRRIGQHLGEGAKRFDAVSSIPCNPSRLDAVEQYYIKRFTPEYNVCRLAQMARRLADGETAGTMDIGPGRPLTAKEAAAFIGVDIGTFRDMAARHVELRGRRAPRSRRRRYFTEDLRHFVAAST